MLLIGGGSLLWQAAAHVARSGHRLDAVCCRPDDPALPRLQRSGLPVAPVSRPDSDLPPWIARCADGLLFSVNNRWLLSDALLASVPRAFNIHGGLTQHHRGLAELCVFSALCEGATGYGVTLHRLAPGQPVDGGEVVDQTRFEIAPQQGFADVMTQVIRHCQAIFERQLEAIVAGQEQARAVPLSAQALGWRDLPALIARTPPERLARARALGPYAPHFPRLLAPAAVAPAA